MHPEDVSLLLLRVGLLSNYYLQCIFLFIRFMTVEIIFSHRHDGSMCMPRNARYTLTGSEINISCRELSLW
jgi:hypothetical protein